MSEISRAEIMEVLEALVDAVDRLIAGPINQDGPKDEHGMGPISQAVGDQYVEADDLIRRWRRERRRR